MKFSKAVSLLTMTSIAATAPINITASTQQENPKIPAEAIIGYLDLEGNKDVALLPFHNDTSNGLLFINTTIASKAMAENESPQLTKREAKWHWLELDWGQPLY